MIGDMYFLRTSLTQGFLSMCNELEGQKIALVGVVAQDLFILSNILLLHKLCLLPVRDSAPRYLHMLVHVYVSCTYTCVVRWSLPTRWFVS